MKTLLTLLLVVWLLAGCAGAKGMPEDPSRSHDSHRGMSTEVTR